MRPIDTANASFLESVADDLQRQLGASGTLVSVGLEEVGSEFAILATVRVGHRTIARRGVGENILTAYADLGRAAPEAILVSAFEQVLMV
jgi:hypothetical protein